ncbi:MAG TPA: hypothetical protein VG777_06875, partial [Thermoanaerobaculia bacterium]|nr:hypothetical protein [Thermoanaerobaculia bacterium]
MSALLHDDDPETPAALSTSTTASSGTWTSWEFEVPATGKESSLEFHLSPGTPHPEDVALARPTLSAPARRSPRIFILFDVDTLRKDRLSLYGYSRPTTPKIDRFFRKGTVWTN